MKITVIGGGNIGTLMAAEMAHKGHEVTMYTSKPEKWNQEIVVFNDVDKVLMTGRLAHITANLKEAVMNANLIWVVVPAELFSDLGSKLEQLVRPEQMVGVVPGCGGAEFSFYGLTKRGCTLFGLQRVHSIARLEKYGTSVHMLGRKSKLELGSIPARKAEYLSAMVGEMFNMPCIALPNYLAVTLTPSNPILHTARLYALFKDYKEGIVYPRNFLFYKEWTLLSSELLIACDEELQKLCKAVPLDLSSVISLKEYYESPTSEAMTKKIREIEAFKSIASPMIQFEDGWIPDLDSRYFSTDFPYGLKLIKDMAAAFGVRTPNIDRIWKWYAEFDPKHANKAFELKYGSSEILRMYR